MPAFSLYALDIPNTKQAFRVSLNGWPVDSSDGGPQGYFSSTMVGEHIADGQNIVTIHVTAPAHGQAPIDRFQVRIRAKTGDVFYYDWEPNDPKRPLPFQTEGYFEAHLPHGPWPWQTAPKITLDAPTKEAINTHIKRLFDALNTKNVEEAYALFAVQARDGYLARNLSVSEADAAGPAEWKRVFAEPYWHLKPIDYAHLRYTLLAGGRVVQVRQANDSSVLMDARADADGSHTAYDVTLCLIDSQWVLVC